MSDGKFRGTVHVIEETKTFGQRGFRKRLVVLEQDNGRFINYVPFEFTRELCDTVDSMNVGDEVEIDYSLNGRKWQRDPNSEVKFFLSAEANGFTVISQQSTIDPNVVNDQLSAAGEDDDDVPF